MNTLSTSLSFENSPVLTSVFSRTQEKQTGHRPAIHYTDEALIDGLKKRDIRVINSIYKQSYAQIKYLVTSNSGSRMDAEDLFQDAMVVIYQKISTEDLKLTSSFKTYLYAICRNLWLQKLNKHQFTFEFKDISNLDEFHNCLENEENIEADEKDHLFQKHFLRLNANDQKVLNLYMAKTSLKEMARIMGYKSDNYAKFRKYICKEKLKNAILNDPQFHELFQHAELVPAMNF